MSNDQVFLRFFENKTVAIVGNAESTFDKKQGVYIDSHDIVIRMNKPGIFYDRENTLEALGSKLDVWAFWDVTAFKQGAYTKNPKLLPKRLIETFKKGDYSLLDMCFHPSRRKKTGFMFQNKDVFKSFKQGPYGPIENPSLGLIVMRLVSLTSPSKVNVFGFDWKKTPTFSEPENHKYVKNGVDSKHWHDFNKEREYALKNYLSMENWNLN